MNIILDESEIQSLASGLIFANSTQILYYGSHNQNNVSKSSKRILDYVSSLDLDKTNQIYSVLVNTLSFVKTKNISSQRPFYKKILNISPSVSDIRRFYTKIKEMIVDCSTELELERSEMLKTTLLFQEEYTKLLNYYKKLLLDISILEIVLSRGDLFSNEIKSRITELKTTQQVAYQKITQFKLIVESNSLVTEKINILVNSIIPKWVEFINAVIYSGIINHKVDYISEKIYTFAEKDIKIIEEIEKNKRILINASR